MSNISRDGAGAQDAGLAEGRVEGVFGAHQ
jgi:hypothetical protein